MIELRWVRVVPGPDTDMSGLVCIDREEQIYQQLEYRYRYPEAYHGFRDYPLTEWSWSDWTKVSPE